MCHDGRPVTPVGRVQRLVFVRLLLSANQPVPLDQLSEDVFEDKALPQHPMETLQVHVSRLRKLLPRRSEGEELIARSPGGYCLHIRPEELDAWRFAQLVTESGVALKEGRLGDVCAILTSGLAMWRGAALRDFAFASYTQAEIRRLNELRLVATENLFEARLCQGEYHQLVPELQAAADLNPLRERLWAQLMRALYLDGRQAEALSAFQCARNRLADELGLVPGPILGDLENAILNHDPRLRPNPSEPLGTVAADASPNAQPRPRAAALRSSLTRFVGRDAAKAELADLLARNRLVTLTGMAGIGKTRLALEMMRATCEAGDEDVAVVELACVQQAHELVPVVAAALGLREESSEEVVAATIGERAVVLLLDNCEHLVRTCAELTWNLLQRCPNLSIVATSQQVLGVPGEAVFTVAALTGPPAGEVELEELTKSEAVQLFCDRASLVKPGFTIDATNGASVGTVCIQLDGLPLAIELAAAAVAVLSVSEIAELLDDRFNLLTGGSQFVATRHQSLLAALEWSHLLLSTPEQVLLRRLSVFTGGATLGAVEEVCADDTMRPGAVFDVLVGLVAKSLVVADTSDRQARYRLLETIRRFAADRLLEAGEHAVIAHCHARWCAGLAERAEPELVGAEQRRWLDRLHVELGNIRTALDWSASERHGDLALRTSAALAALWARCHWTEGIDRLQRALSVGADRPPLLRARALWALSTLGLRAGDDGLAADAAVASLRLAQECDNTRGQGRALVALGSSLTSTRHGTPALQQLDRGVELARQANDWWCVGKGLTASGWVHLHRGDPGRAQRPFEEALSLVRQRHDEPELVPNLLGLGHVAVGHGDLGLAGNLLQEALGLTDDLDDKRGTLAVLKLMARMEIARGDHGAARSLLADLFSLAGEVAPWSSSAMECLHLMGRLELDTGDVGRAHQAFLAAEHVLERIGGTSSHHHLGFAEIARRNRDFELAREELVKAGVAARWKGNTIARAEVAFQLGELARATGNIDEAVAHHRRALSMLHSVENFAALAASLEALADLAIDPKDISVAVQLLAAAERLREERGPARAPCDVNHYDAVMSRARAACSVADFERWWRDGQSFRLDVVVSLALGQLMPPDEIVPRQVG